MTDYTNLCTNWKEQFIITLNFFLYIFRKVHGTIYKSGQISEVIYLASGSSGDWAHEKLGIKYSFALELRDLGQYGFLLPVNQIKPTVEETFAGMVAMAHEVYKELK